MCGIVGHFSLNLEDKVARSVDAASSLLFHRGPDSSGTYSARVAGGNILLAHRRLSIIDLSPAGAQPMSTEDGRYTIVFNGEIYNYRELRTRLEGRGFSFESDCDTEVLLKAWGCWGEKVLPGLKGMFSFAIFDRQALVLTCACDPFGIKPFFYSQAKGSFSFASEVPALRELSSSGQQCDIQKAYDYLVWSLHDNDERTFFKGISRLGAGQLLKVDLNNIAEVVPKTWWNPSISERTDIDFKEAAAELRRMFLENVQFHLRSDVPLGFALSGGIDSSAIVCAARRLHPDMPIRTFTFEAESKAISESKWARIVGDYVGSEQHFISVEPRDIEGDIDGLIKAQGEPFGSSTIYAQYRVFEAMREDGIVVSLDGQGADELLGGYFGYPDACLQSMLEKGEYRSAARFIRNWSQGNGRSFRKASLYVGMLLVPDRLRGLARAVAGNSPSPGWLRTEALLERGVRRIVPQPISRTPEGRGRRLSERLRLAMKHSLNRLLRYQDRNSMHWSLESRVPFLTREMAEFCLSLPESFLVNENGVTKSVFRAAMRDIVPDEILDRRDKIGFETPERRWLAGCRPKIEEWLSDLESIEFLNAEKTRRYVFDAVDGKARYSWQIWRILNFARWHNLMIRS